MTVTDAQTAEAFATSWNNLPAGSIYSAEQFDEWMMPLSRSDISGRTVLELGCVNGSIAVHLLRSNPAFLTAVDLGDSTRTAELNLQAIAPEGWAVVQADLLEYRGQERFDLVVCIGVLHHLQKPQQGFAAVIRNTRPGGRFHCWVYAREGNGFVVYFVEPLRKLCCRLPWRVTKYAVATPLAVPLYLLARGVRLLRNVVSPAKLPLGEYLAWLAKYPCSFARHVIFDQLVTPRTVYIPKEEIRRWLALSPEVDQASVYVNPRNGNSWIFGGKLKER